MMSKIKETIRSPHVHIALATGFSIIIMAVASKRWLPEKIAYLPMAVPPFLATVYESMLPKYKNTRICTTWYWITAILISTALVILYYMFRPLL